MLAPSVPNLDPAVFARLRKIVRERAGIHLGDHKRQLCCEIVTSVKKVSDIIAEITVASEEQASGIEQIALVRRSGGVARAVLRRVRAARAA